MSENVYGRYVRQQIVKYADILHAIIVDELWIQHSKGTLISWLSGTCHSGPLEVAWLLNLHLKWVSIHVTK